MINFVAILLMVVLAGTTYYSINSLLKTDKLVEHTQKLISYGYQLTEELFSMETAERGFLITGKEKFLEPYYESKNKFDKWIEEAKQLIFASPAQVKRLETIEGLVKEWIEVAAEPEISMRKKVRHAE